MKMFVRLLTGFLIVSFVALMVMTYRTKAETETLRERVAVLEAEIKTAQGENKTLAADVAFLEDPQRLARIAREQLSLGPAASDQRVSLAELDSAIARVSARRAAAAQARTAATESPAP
jgi:cell division protein FtsL